ncbi:MAG: insulinase family protein [bacterium]
MVKRDRQHFETTLLDNGISLHTYQDAFPISCMEVQFPVGSGHAIPENGLLPGSPHFLEHCQLIRSQDFPEAYALDRTLGMKAGNSNATTYAKKTTYWIDTPAAEQDFGIDLLVNRVFRPIFQDADLPIQQGVVANERDQNRFYPANTRAGQYYYKEFIYDVLYPLEQLFGSDADLAAIDAEQLQAMHRRISHSNQIVALAVGPGPFDRFRDQLAALPTQPLALQSRIEPVRWTRREHHQVFFDSVSQPRLETTWIHDRPSWEDYCALNFFLNLLVNTTQGPLYREFREEKGWTYGLDSDCDFREDNLVLNLSFPVNTVAQAEEIRACLDDRIQKAASDQKLVEDEITRQLGSQVYSFQTAGSIVTDASQDLINHGRIYTEAEHTKAVRNMADPEYRKSLLRHYFDPTERGSVLFLPERRGA